MTPIEYVAEELSKWQRALQEQREAEAALEAARKKRKHALIIELMPKIDLLRTKADLLLADAVKLMCLLRDGALASDWLITAPDAPPDGDDHEV